MDRSQAPTTITEVGKLPQGSGQRHALLMALGFAVLYLLGVIHWTWFFHRGHLTFQAYDWPKEAMYFQVLRDALVSGRVPYHIAVPPEAERAFEHLRGGRFLGLPETLLSPQILLLPWLKSTGLFVLAHILLLYTLGFVGSLALARRYLLGFVAFTSWFLLFNFNGYLVAHLGAGHSMWSGYLLLPFVELLVFQIVEQPGLLRPAYWLALTFFVMLLQGSFHLVMWCWMFVGLLVATRPALWKQGLIAAGFSGFMAAFRLIPTAVTYWGFQEYFFLGGYPTPASLAEALIVIRDPETLVDIGSPWTSTGLLLHWWEYDVYVGLAGLAVLGYFGIVCRWRRYSIEGTRPWAALDLPMAIMAIVSLSYVYWPIYNLPLPFVNSERVASRFIVVPFVLLLALACLHMNAELKRTASSWAMRGAIVVGLATLAVPLAFHSAQWLIAYWERKPEAHWIPVQTVQIVEQNDPVYVASIWLGLAISMLATLAWGVSFSLVGRRTIRDSGSVVRFNSLTAIPTVQRAP